MNLFAALLSTALCMIFMTRVIEAGYPCKMVVIASVANLVDTPGFDNAPHRGFSFSRNVPHLQTQLLCNDQVIALEEKVICDQKWVKVQVQEQKKVHFDDEKGLVISHYTGWMRARDLSLIFDNCNYRQDYIVSSLYKTMCIGESKVILPFGTKLHIGDEFIPGFCRAELIKNNGLVLSGKLDTLERDSFTQLPDLKNLTSDLLLQKELRDATVHYARLFLGMPYVWGGCSPYLSHVNHLTGVDCSGLIYLCYRACGFELPRDAHDQFLATYPVHPANLQPGDLVFFGAEHEQDGKKMVCINHVLMYTDQETLIEARGNQAYDNVDNMSDEERAVLLVCETPFEERLGKPLSQFFNGEFFQEKNVFVYFRTVFPLID